MSLTDGRGSTADEGYASVVVVHETRCSEKCGSGVRGLCAQLTFSSLLRPMCDVSSSMFSDSLQ